MFDWCDDATVFSLLKCDPAVEFVFVGCDSRHPYQNGTSAIEIGIARQDIENVGYDPVKVSADYDLRLGGDRLTLRFIIYYRVIIYYLRVRGSRNSVVSFR